MTRWWTRVRRWVLIQISREIRHVRAELAAVRDAADRDAVLYAQILADRDQQIGDFRREVAGLESEVEHWKAETARERRLGNAAWQRVGRLRRVGTTSEQPEQLTDLREEKEVRT